MLTPVEREPNAGRSPEVVRALACLGLLALGCSSSASPNPGAARYKPVGATNAWDPASLSAPAPAASVGAPNAGAPAPVVGPDPSTSPATAGSAAPPIGSGGGAGAAGAAFGAAGAGGAAAPVVDPIAGSAAPPMMTGPKPTSVTLDFTTANQGGRYQPRNVGAVWVANASGQWVKALEVWAFIRARHLTKWLGADPTGNRVDAISMATLSRHGPHHSTWNLKDAFGTEAPDGDYTIFIEVTEREDRPGEFTSITFTKGPMPQTVTIPDSPFYTGVKLVYQ